MNEIVNLRTEIETTADGKFINTPLFLNVDLYHLEATDV